MIKIWGFKDRMLVCFAETQSYGDAYDLACEWMQKTDRGLDYIQINDNEFGLFVTIWEKINGFFKNTFCG